MRCGWRIPAAMIVFLMLLVSFPSRDGQVVTYSTKIISKSEREQSAAVIALMPDDQSSAAIVHFNSAQLAMRHRQWNVAQVELERALTLAETFRFASATAEMRAQQLAQFQQYNETYRHLLMRDAVQVSAGTVQAKILAWEANERAHWWLWRQTMAEMSGQTSASALLSGDERAGLLQAVQARLLDDRTVLLEFALGERQSFLWSISKNAVNVYALPAQSVIQAAVLDAYQRLSAPSQANNDVVIDRLREMILGEWLAKDESARLPQAKVLIVADGALRQVPFSVLLDTHAQPSLDSWPKRTITNIPAALVLLEKKKLVVTEPPVMSSGVAVLADPVFNKFDERVEAANNDFEDWLQDETSIGFLPASWSTTASTERLRSWPEPLTAQVTRLPYARHEAASVAQWFKPSATLRAVGFDASRELAMSGRLASYPVVHFATHGFVNDRHPEQSGLVLSQLNESGDTKAGILQLRDICRLRLPAELVVLSACESGIAQKPQRRPSNKVAASLSEGFFYAGAHRVLGTLWQVNDVATAELMKIFYAGLLGEQHLSPAAALSQAQMTLAQDARWRDPYYWAAFVLVGEW